MSLDRRSFLGAGALLAAPQLLLAQAATERRLVFIIQRGAADGLTTLIPYAEPAYASLRGALAIDAAAALKLDGSFALHPALPGLRDLHAAREHAVAHQAGQRVQLRRAEGDKNRYPRQQIFGLHWHIFSCLPLVPLPVVSCYTKDQ